MGLVSHPTDESGKPLAAVAPAKKKGKHWYEKVLGSGPVSTTLDVLTRPAYAVGNLIEGHGIGALKAFTPGKFKRVLPGQALQERGLLPKHGVLGGVSSFVASAALDPTTWVSPGGASAARQALKIGSQKVTAEVAEAIAKGGRPSLEQTARHIAEATAAYEKVPKAISVNLKVPFTRGKTVTLAESKKAHAAIAKPLGKLGETQVGKATQNLLRPGGTAHPVVKAVVRATEVAVANDKKAITKDIAEFRKLLYARDKELGLKKGTVADAIGRHIDDPKGPGSQKFMELGGKADDLLQVAKDKLANYEKHALETGVLTEKQLRPDYVPHMPADKKTAEFMAGVQHKRSEANQAFMQHRAPGYETFTQWEKQGLKPVTDITTLLEARGHQAVSAIGEKARQAAIGEHFGKTHPLYKVPTNPMKMQKITQRVADNARIAKSPAEIATPEEWNHVRQEWKKFAGPFHKDMRVPPEIKAQYDAVMARMDRTMNAPAGVYEAKTFLHRIGTQWKSLALLSPGFHFRNSFDDALRAYFAGGRNPLSYITAGKIMAGVYDDHVIRLKGGKTMTGKQIRLEAEATGAIDRGFVSADLGVTKKSHRPGEGKVSQGSKKFGDWRENTFRLGTYIEMRKAGHSAIDAALRVKEHHFDYGDVSNFVARARQFWLPFVTYQSKAIPYVARQAVQNPGRLANVNKLMQQTGGNIGFDPSQLLPNQRLSFPIPGIGGKDNPTLLNPQGVFAFSSPNLLDPRYVQQNVLGGLVNPIARAPLEALTGYSAFRGRSMKNQKGETAVVRAPAWMTLAHKIGLPLPGFKPDGYKDSLTGKKSDGVVYTNDTIMRLLPIYSQMDTLTGGAAKDPVLGAFKYGLGLPVQPYDRQKEAARAAKYAK